MIYEGEQKEVAKVSFVLSSLSFSLLTSMIVFIVNLDDRFHH